MLKGVTSFMQVDPYLANELKLVRDKAIVSEFKSHLKHFERMIRVFEMTYLDLCEVLRDQVKQHNLLAETSLVKVRA